MCRYGVMDEGFHGIILFTLKGIIIQLSAMSPYWSICAVRMTDWIGLVVRRFKVINGLYSLFRKSYKSTILGQTLIG